MSFLCVLKGLHSAKKVCHFPEHYMSIRIHHSVISDVSVVVCLYFSRTMEELILTSSGKCMFLGIADMICVRVSFLWLSEAMASEKPNGQQGSLEEDVVSRLSSFRPVPQSHASTVPSLSVDSGTYSLERCHMLESCEGDLMLQSNKDNYSHLTCDFSLLSIFLQRVLCVIVPKQMAFQRKNS